MAASPAYAAEPPPACSGAEHREFDFWLGSWDVHAPDGRLAGRNEIASEYGGCVIHERYSTERGYRGESLNMPGRGGSITATQYYTATGLDELRYREVSGAGSGSSRAQGNPFSAMERPSAKSLRM